MHKWFKEKPNERAVFCIASNNNGQTNALFGSSLQLTSALLAAMLKKSDFEEICKDALTLKENPIAAFALISALEKRKKEQKISDKEDNTDPSKEFLKAILSKLAKKL